MKALTIQQPWAWAIAAGFKDVENRQWGTDYRGPLAIHAGKAHDGDGDWHIRQTLAAEFWPDFDAMTHGAFIAVVDLAGICTRSYYGAETDCHCGVEEWAQRGQRHWQIRNPRPIEPVPYRGRLGLWDVPDSIAASFQYTGPIKFPGDFGSVVPA